MNMMLMSLFRIMITHMQLMVVSTYFFSSLIDSSSICQLCIELRLDY